MATPGELTTPELLALVKQSVGGRNSGLMTDAWYITRLNSAYSRLCTFQGVVMAPGMRRPQFRVIRFYELYEDVDHTLVIGTDNFIEVLDGLTADSVVYVDNVYDRTNDRPLKREAIRYMNSQNPDDLGIPRRWCPSGNHGSTGYFIHPHPGVTNDVITVRERTYNYPPELVDATPEIQNPIIPGAWHKGIWLAAVAEVADIIDWPEKSAEFEQKFMKFLAERRSPVEEAGAAGGRRHFTVGGL